MYKNKPFTPYEISYMHGAYNKYDLPSEIMREVMLYNRKINNGLILHWFLDRVTDYIVTYNAKTPAATRTLLDTFHNKYVVPFGRETPANQRYRRK